MMYDIAICDDDAVFLDSFQPMLTNILDAHHIAYQLTLFNDPSALSEAMQNGREFHLLFLDIYYETEKGIQFAKSLREKQNQIDIVFMTSLPDYAIESFDAAPLHYLLKPIEPEKLETALMRFLDKNAPQKLHFMTSAGHLCLSIPDILFFEIYGHDIIIHLTNGNSEACAGTLKELERLLPELTFVRPHRSYLINLRHITKISRYQIRLSSGDTIPVSKNLYHAILNSFIIYANQNCISY